MPSSENMGSTHINNTSSSPSFSHTYFPLFFLKTNVVHLISKEPKHQVSKPGQSSPGQTGIVGMSEKAKKSKLATSIITYVKHKVK